MTDNKQKVARLQQHRLRMTLLSLANMSLQALVLGLYVLAGELSWQVFLAFAAAGVGSSALFALVIKKRWNLRLKEPGMLLPQLVTCFAIQLLFLVLAPQLWVLFLVAIFVTYNFAMMTFNPRQFTAAWILVGLSMAGALYLAGDGIEHLGVTRIEAAILWLFFFLCLRQLTAIGSQFSELRQKLSQRNRELSASLETLQALAGQQRLVERERIARELHDTLVQGIQGLILQFQSAAERIPPSEPARAMLEDALEQADQVLIAGRDQLSGLHIASSAGADLPQALNTAGEELSGDYGVAFEFKVHGQPRELQAIVEAESYRVGREALLNAFQHSRGEQVVAEVTFGTELLRVQVRDDGVGIDARTLDEIGLQHGGLAGMQARARRLGGSLAIRIGDPGGTEIDLSVPCALAYQLDVVRRPPGMLHWLNPWERGS